MNPRFLPPTRLGLRVSGYACACYALTGRSGLRLFLYFYPGLTPWATKLASLRDSLECVGKTTCEFVLTDSEILARGSSEIIPCGDSEITAETAVVMGGLNFDEDSLVIEEPAEPPNKQECYGGIGYPLPLGIQEQCPGTAEQARGESLEIDNVNQ